MAAVMDKDIRTFPRKTKLQNQVLDWINAGKPWRGSGWFVLKEDAADLDKQVYRSRFPPKSVPVKE